MMRLYLFCSAFCFFPEFIFSQDSIRIIFPGQFHDDEINNELVNEKWFGLIEHEGGYYLSKTKIHISKIFDPVLDEDTLKPSGDLITIEEDNCILLINGLNTLKEKQIDGMRPQKYFLMPGEEMEFDFKNLHYKISAIGYPVDPISGWLNGNYQLFIEEINQLKIKQLISEDTLQSESPYNIIWMGDLDNDNEIDLLINLSNHYNHNLPVLFLSSRKINGIILQRSAEFSSVGC